MRMPFLVCTAEVLVEVNKVETKKVERRPRKKVDALLSVFTGGKK